MKNLASILAAAALTLATPLISAAAHDHSAMGHNDMAAKGSAAHEEVIEGVKATFEVLDMQQQMKGMAMPKGMKETHHIMVRFTDVKSGKLLTEGEVRAKVLAPDKSEQTKELKGMQGHFGADFDLAMKGKYGVMCRFQLKDGTVRSAKFWYTVK